MKLLIVDDSPNIRQNLRRFISAIGGIEIIDEAEDEKSAVELALQKKSDVIILDIDLKEGNGFNVLKKVKTLNDSTVVVVFSNFVTSSYREMALKEKADYILDKNSELDKLISILQKLASEK